MGYLYLAISVLAGAAKGYCGKRTSGYAADMRSAGWINLVRMGLCVLLGLLLLCVQGQAAALAVDGTTLAIAAVSGVTTAVFVVSWLLAVRRGAYMMLDVFILVGVFVTLLCSRVVYAEPIRPLQYVGLVLLLGAVLLLCSYSGEIKDKISLPTLLLLLVCGVSNGLTDFSQKMFVRQTADVPVGVFNLYTYLFAGVVLLLVLPFLREKAAPDGQPPSPASVLRRVMPYVAVMAACLFASSYFKTLAAGYLTAAQLYPLSQGCAMTLSAVMAAVFFRERMTPKCIAGLCLAFAALLFINVLGV